MATEDRRIGRPTKLNEDIARRLIEAFAKGASKAGACRYAGISHDSLDRWIDAGRAELAAIESRPEGEYPCSDAAALVMAIDRALGEFEVRHLGNIEFAAQSPKNWRAAAFLIERRLYKDWGRRAPADHIHELIERTKDLARRRGLDDDATAALIDFTVERAKRRAG